ncbi:MAG: AAA family ATPase [bacterium]|nr:AAA family ATPase [bacterium]
MRLLRAECHGFGKLVGSSIAFGPGLTLVLGPNEAGKSTLVDAIMAALYGLRGRAATVRELRELRFPWQPQVPYAVTLTLATGDGQEILVHRDLAGGQAQVWRKTSSGLLPVDESELGAVLAQSGVPSLALFTSTFMVRQAEVALLDRKTLGQALVEKITGGEAAVTAREAIKKLERRRQELVRGGDRQPGLLAQAGERLRRWQESRDRTAGKADRYYEALTQSQELQARREAVIVELGRLDPLVDGYDQMTEASRKLEQKQAELDKEAGRLAAYQRLGRKLTAVEEELAGLALAHRYDAWRERTGESLEGLEISLAGLEQQLQVLNERTREREERARETATHLQALREELGALDPEGLGENLLLRAEELIREREEHLRQAEDRRTQADLLAPRARLANWCFRGFLLTVALAAALASGWLAGRLPLIWGALAAAALAGLLLGGYLRTMGEIRHRDLLASDAAHYRRQATELEGRLARLTGGSSLGDLRERSRQLQVLAARVGDAERSRDALALALEMSGAEDLVQAIAGRRRQLDRLLGRLGVESLEEARSLVARHRELTASRGELRAEMAGLLGQETPEAIQGRTEALAGEVATLQSIRDSLRQELRVDIKPHEYVEYAARQEELRAGLAEIDRTLNLLAERVRVLRADLAEGDPWEVQARIDSERQSIERLEREAQGLEIACQMLAEAAEEAQRMVAPALQDRAGELLARFTGNRYRELAIEVLDGELAVKVRSPETGQFIPDGSLSTGTRDQLYLALRVALAGYLAGTDDFPLILDDAFVHYDGCRLANTAAALAELATARQIIWVSKDEQLPRLLPEATVLKL